MIFKLLAIRNIFLSSLFLLISCYLGAQEENNVSSQVGFKQHSVESLYHSDIVGISESGISKGQSAMQKRLAKFTKNHGIVQSFKTHYRRSVVSGLDYEIGSFQTERGGKFSHVIIWSKENGKDKRLLEVVYEATSINKDVPIEIDKAREKWVRLCNSHNSDKLVRQLYTKDAIYYNRGGLLVGHEALFQEYSYMQQPTYELQLASEHIEMVNDNMAFEIGQCSGSYPLPYILIWKKQQDGSWKVFMDSNY